MSVFPDNGLMKVKRRMHKLKVNKKLLLGKREKVRYGGRCINDEEEDSILSGFTSDVKA